MFTESIDYTQLDRHIERPLRITTPDLHGYWERIDKISTDNNGKVGAARNGNYSGSFLRNNM